MFRKLWIRHDKLWIRHDKTVSRLHFFLILKKIVYVPVLTWLYSRNNYVVSHVLVFGLQIYPKYSSQVNWKHSSLDLCQWAILWYVNRRDIPHKHSKTASVLVWQMCEHLLIGLQHGGTLSVRLEQHRDGSHLQAGDPEREVSGAWVSSMWSVWLS